MDAGAGANLKVGDGVSVRHVDDGHRHECKVLKIEENMVLLHWHGYKGKAGPWQDFWLERSSDRLGSIEAADVEPPRPAKSLKTRSADHDRGQVEDIAGTQELVALDTSVPASECCSKCSEPLHELSVKCDGCVYRMHMSCSGLPNHRLYRVLEYGVGIVCEFCVVIKKSETKDSAADEPDLIDNVPSLEKGNWLGL